MGTNYIAPTWRMPENSNKDKLSNYSIDFDNTITNKIVCGDAVAYNTFTLSAWANPSSPVSYAAIFGSRNGAGVFAYLLSTDNTDKFRFTVDDGSSKSIYSDSTFSNDTWYHIVCVADGTNIKMYVNGTLQVDTDTYGTLVTPSDKLMIGAQYEADTQYEWSGKIGQCCLFDYALTDGTGGTTNQIGYLYNLNNPMAITGAEPIAYYPLGDNSNPTATAGYPNVSVGADSVFDFESGDNTFIKAFDVPVTTFTEATVSVWVNFESVSGTYQYVMGMGSGPGNFMSISLWAGGSVWYTFDGSTSQSTATGASAGKWYNVVVTQTGTTRRFYINGIEDANSPFTVNALAIPYNNLTLGAYNNSSSATPSPTYRLDGQLSNFQIWDKKIEQADVTTLYNNGQPLMTGTQPEQANLKAWYKLNQTANWEADTAGNWQIPDAMSSYPQSFNFISSSNQYIDLDPGVMKDFTSDNISISAWVKANTLNAYDYIFVDGYTSGNKIVALNYANVRGGLEFTVGNGSVSRASGVSINTGRWYHVVCTYAAGGDLKFYLDGNTTPVATATFSGALDLSSHTKSSIGRSNVHSGNYWDGEISNVQIWNTELGTSDVTTLYNGGRPYTGTQPQAANIKGWWKMNVDTSNFTDGNQWEIGNSTSDFSSSLKFTGNSQLNLSEINLGTTNSISFWFKVTNVPGSNNDFYFLGADNNASNYVLYSANGTSFLFRISPSSDTGFLTFTSTPTLWDGKWHNLLITRNNSTFNMYVDGTALSGPTGSVGTGNTVIDTIANQNNNGVPGYAIYNDAFTGELSNLVVWNSDQTSEKDNIYNNGSPATSYTNTPVSWWKLDNLTTGIQDSVGSSNATLQGTKTYQLDTPVSVFNGTSSGMTTANLVNNNVSVLNGESSGMNTTNLVQSNLTRKQPFSSYSIDFDAASNTRISLGTAPTLSSVLTISAWFKKNSLTPDYAGVFGTRNSTLLQMPYILSDAGSEKFRFRISQSNGIAVELISASALSDDVWYNVVGVADGSNINLYINGVPETPISYDGTIITPSNDLTIGAQNEVAGNNPFDFDGSISNCALWNSALNQDDVLNIYNNGISQDLTNFKITPTRWYPIDQSYTYFNGSVLVARDVINGNDGTGVNLIQENIVGDAPGSTSSGTGSNLTIADLKGDMKSSINNSYSINMADYADGVTNPANSGRSTNVP